MSSPPYPHQRLKLKTYSHLGGEHRLPTEYELVTGKLLYYPGRGFEVNTPLREWYRRYQTESPLRCSDWDLFRDPRETTYGKYASLQRNKEVFVEGILQSIETNAVDETLTADWKKHFAGLLSVLRFPYHGLMMAAAYSGSMAPGGRLTVTLALQSADEMRKVQLFAERLVLLQGPASTAAARGKELWCKEPAWQPLREAVEKLLVTYDLSESVVALNLCVKPVLDEFSLVHFPRAAKLHGDAYLQPLLGSLLEDAVWQRRWTAALFRTLFSDNAENERITREMILKWRPLVGAFAEAATKLLKDLGLPETGRLADDVMDGVFGLQGGSDHG